MQLASLGYRTDLAILRLGGSRIEDRGDHLVVTSPHAPTYWWGNFLLVDHVPTHDDCEFWLQRFASTFPGAKHVAVGFDGTAGSLFELAWFTARGFSAEALAVMTAGALHEPAHINRDAVCRELSTDEDWAASVELRARCTPLERAGTYSRDFDIARALTNRRITQAGHGRWFGAFLDGRLVAQLGLVAAGERLARFQSVETDPDFRRRGLAASLIHHAGVYGTTELGAETLVIVADPTYVAVSLYRALGFEQTESQLLVERAPARSR
ncbi:MAG: GNAT family N-acetyltransferase [Candidatus Dormibacteraeota bacterium]|nr:GNAT family N-acetyltransferase [Candidatus Dormibacteraeota bacterium]